MKSWKTTLIACLMAAFVAIEPYVSTGQFDWKKLIYAALIAAFGVLAKDFNVSGNGSKSEQPKQ